MKKLIALILTAICIFCIACNNQVALKAEDCQLPVGFSLPQKTIYSLGEATHGSAEFQLTRQNLFEYLVREHGVRAFCLEMDFGEGLKINSLLYDDQWNAKNITKQFQFWSYTSDETAALLQWMHDYNAAVPEEEKVRFYGIDCQTAEYSIAWLSTFLGSYAPDLAQKWINSPLFALTLKDFYFLTSTTDYLHAVDLLSEDIQENAPSILQLSSDKECDIAIRLVTCLKYCLLRTQSGLELNSLSLELDSTFNYDSDNMTEEEIQEYGEKRVSHLNTRDEFMADIVRWIVEHEQEYYGKHSIFITGHNYHTLKEPLSTEGFSAIGYSMGYHLKEEFLEEYYAIGTEFGVGEFYAIDFNTNKLKSFSLKNPLPISEYFQGTEDAIQYVNSNELQTLFRAPIKMHSIAALFGDELVNDSDRFTMTLSPPEAYNGLFYFPRIYAFRKI